MGRCRLGSLLVVMRFEVFFFVRPLAGLRPSDFCMLSCFEQYLFSFIQHPFFYMYSLASSPLAAVTCYPT